MKSAACQCLMLVFLAVGTCTLSPYAQSQNTTLPLGTWGPIHGPTSCPSNFYPTSCSFTTISCKDANNNLDRVDLIATYGYKVAPNAKGTIVIFSGGGGLQQGNSEQGYATDYWQAGYTVVQVVWNYDWEDTNGNPTLPQLYSYSIKAAACAPATFLNLVYTTIYSTGTGFCAQGASGGAAAIGYSLAWYGGEGTNYRLDNVELIDGPMFSDLKQGCAENNFMDSGDVTVCGPGTSQLGCRGWPQTPPVTLTPEYVFGSERGIQEFTGDSTCTVGQGTSGTTSMWSNTAWLNQSVVSTGANFSYSKTTMAGWLCASVFIPPNITQPDCTDDNTSGAQFCLNPSTSQGQIFFAKFTNQNQLNALPSLNAVNQCSGPEGVDTGIVAFDGNTGRADIEQDMENNCLRHP